MFAPRNQNEIELPRRTARIFPDERQEQSKVVYEAAIIDRVGGNRLDGRTTDRSGVWNENKEAPRHFFLDPSSNIILGWNQVHLMACLFALFIDPFFYYVPLVSSTSDGTFQCIDSDQHLSITITVFRSLADLFYIINIAVKFHTAYIAPSSRVLGKGELVTDIKAIQRKYIKKGFLVDLLAALPLPQFTIWLVIPSIKSPDLNVRNTTFGLVVLFQYILRMCLIVPLRNQMIKATGVVTKTAWGGAAYNLLLYMLASHITGAIYYLLVVERQITCWNSSCSNETSCDLKYISCSNSGSSDYQSWSNSTNVFANCLSSSSSFSFGIFMNALRFKAVSAPFAQKYFYCLWWGLQQLSSSGNPLMTSTFILENAFAIIIGAVSLILFAQLIGNMQTYLQSISKRLEEWRLRQRDTEEWMNHHQLPPQLQERVRRFVQVKWLATRGVEEESILQALPADIRRDVQRHLCFDLVRRVPFFAEMDDQLLDAICERLISFLCPEGTFVAREGDPVKEMLFIIRGELDSSTTDGGRSNFFNSIMLRPGDFSGDELLDWALFPKDNVNYPLSKRTVKALSVVEAFALRAEDLKFVANQFRRLHSKKLQHTFKFYAPTWRTWAACYIQEAWRQRQRRKMAELLSQWEASYSSDAQEATSDQRNNGRGNVSSMIEGAIVQMQRLASRRYLTEGSQIPRPQKPDEPDFSADPSL